MIIISLVLSGISKSVWFFVNTIQLMAYLRFFVTWPANSQLVLECFESAITGLSLSELFWQMLGSDYNDFADAQRFTEPLNPLIGETNLLRSLGLYPWIFALFIFLTVATFVMFAMRKLSFDVLRIYLAMKSVMIFNAFLRFAIEIFLRLFHQSLAVLLLYGVSKSAPVFSVHAVGAFISFVIILTIMVFLCVNYGILDHAKLASKTNSLYDGIKTYHQWTAHYTTIFLWHRVLLVVIIVLLDSWVIFKI